MHKRSHTNRGLFFFLLLLVSLPAFPLGHKLTGTVIGTPKGYNYNTGGSSSTVNIGPWAFDGDLTTYFAASSTSGGWVGLDLGNTYIITRIGFAASTRSNGPERTLLGLFEGANRPDFSDALPLFMMWLRFGWLIILYGAQFSYSFQTVEGMEKAVVTEKVEVA